MCELIAFKNAEFFAVFVRANYVSPVIAFVFPHCIRAKSIVFFPSFQDGLISFSELMIVMYVMSSGTPEENLRRIFRVFDANGDGHVTRFNLQYFFKK